MKVSFRNYHLYQLLRQYEATNLPIDVLMGQYFRENKSLGSKDKRFVSETFYGLIRWKGLVDYFCPRPITWESRVDWYTQKQPKQFIYDLNIPPHIRTSFPQDFFRLIEKNYGLEKAIEICLASNETAPTTIRVNSLKISREKLLEKWNGSYVVTPCVHSKNGIQFLKKINFFELEEFKNGFFEVQDEASQLAAELVDAKPNQQILDFCAGAGGKTLAFAPYMQNKGQIYLHDIREKALGEAKKRLARAGVQNAQVCCSDDPKLRQLKGKMDAVLVDVPCSGSGTLRRNPDIKWKFSSGSLQNLIETQRKIFSEALSFVRPNGKIIYTTCSLLKEENEDQIDFFIANFPVELQGNFFKTVPQSGQMDGFFGSVLSKNTSIC